MKTIIALIVLLFTISGMVLGVRQYYVNLGWQKALIAVKQQDDHAVIAAQRVEKKTAECDATNGYWDVLTQNCKLQGEEDK
jgi:disulfide bond formation protein DsbB